MSFDLVPASKENINQKVKPLNASNAIGLDGIPVKPMKLSANFVEKYLASIINHDISQSHFSDGAKDILVRPIYKKKDKQDKKNYRPVSTLKGFSKSDKLCFSLQKTLVSLIENWKKSRQ